MWPNQGLVK